jgi:hypothetical protein
MRYEFRVDGRLTEEAKSAFAGMQITEVPLQTAIDGEVLDESHLHGVIVQFQALGITVVSVRPIPADPAGAGRTASGRDEGSENGGSQRRPQGVHESCPEGGPEGVLR